MTIGPAHPFPTTPAPGSPARAPYIRQASAAMMMQPISAETSSFGTPHGKTCNFLIGCGMRRTTQRQRSTMGAAYELAWRRFAHSAILRLARCASPHRPSRQELQQSVSLPDATSAMARHSRPSRNYALVCSGRPRRPSARTIYGMPPHAFCRSLRRLARIRSTTAARSCRISAANARASSWISRYLSLQTINSSRKGSRSNALSVSS